MLFDRELNLNVSTSTVCRSLKCMKFEYKRLPYKFHLTFRHRKNRVRAARDFIMSWISWNKVIFSDGKLFTVHDSSCYYAWLDKNMSRRRVRQVVRFPGLMVWAMIIPNGLLSYEIMKDHQKSEDYTRLLETKALPIVKLNYGEYFFFQQDNCPIHVAKKCKQYFMR